MATVTIKHASLTGAAANPAVLVDGPKWDASHTVTGLENVPNVDTTNASNITSGLLAAAQGGQVNNLESFAGADSTAQFSAAIAAGVREVQLTANITLTAQIDLPSNFSLNGNGFTITQGASVTTLFTMAEGSRIRDCRLNGNGTLYTGDMIQITAGNNQRLVNVDIFNTAGYNLNFAANVGANFVWDGGSFNRTTATNNAIITVSELQTTGPRFFLNLNGNGSWGYDLGGHYSVIQGGSMLSLTFRSTSSYVQILGGTRIASAPTILGGNHTICATFDAGVTIGDGSGTFPSGTSATQCTIYAQPGLTITDSSRSNTNQIIPAPSNTWIQYMAAAGNIGWRLFQGGSAALNIGTNSSSVPYLRSQNSLGLNIGGNTTDYLFIAPGGKIGIGTASTPGATLSISQNVTATTPPSNALLELVSGDNVFCPLVVNGFGTAAVPSVEAFRALGTAASPSVVTTGTQLFAVYGKGYDGVGPFAAAFPGIVVGAAETFSSGHNGARVDIVTVPTASTSGAVAARFQASGGLSVGAASTDPGIGAILANTSIKSQGATFGIGYATGAGLTVTQTTGRTNGVTINAVCGAITLVSAAGSTSTQKFTVTNSAVAATDIVIVNQKSGTDRYQMFVTAIGAGSFDINFATLSGTTTEQPVFNFAVVKAVTS